MEKHYTVVGLGMSGFSCVEFLHAKKIPFTVMDTRENPPYLKAFQEKYADIPCTLGKLDENFLHAADIIVLSPGIQKTLPELIKQKAKPMIGDIELFAQYANAPIIGITGSNGKSTVTALTGEVLKQAGLSVLVGGNIGVPALQLLSQAQPDYYVLEISSFQLETTYSLKLKIATILNISENHLDHHASMQEYIAAKKRIYQHAEMILINREDSLTSHVHSTIYSFGESTPAHHQTGLQSEKGALFLAYENQKIMPARSLKIQGKHNVINALSVIAIAKMLNIPNAPIVKALENFTGLAHRCQLVTEKNDIKWINDSKATTVAATIAALKGFQEMIEGNIILLAGGLGKGADFSPLKKAVASKVKAVILFGKDAALLKRAIEPVVSIHEVSSLAEAIQIAQTLARPGDVVLLSPACASYDMFLNFEDRGEKFTNLVRSVVGESFSTES